MATGTRDDSRWERALHIGWFQKRFWCCDVTNFNDILNAETENHMSVLRPDRRSQVEELLKEEMKSGHFIITDKKPTIINALGRNQVPLN